MSGQQANENPLFMAWHDSAWIPILNPSNVMDYFSERSNTFYDRTCNNEIVKMQRLNPEQLNNMVGLEYILLHVQEPILYIIRKQHRHSPTQVTPLADYYIIAGVVYQAPDLASVINSRMLNTIHNLESAFSEAQSFSRYHPSKGYSWEFKDKQETEKSSEKKKKKEEPSSMFQRRRVDELLADLTGKFPPPSNPAPAPTAATAATTGGTAPTGAQPIASGANAAASASKTGEDAVKGIEIKTEIKTEKMDTSQPPDRSIGKPPPEKKPKLLR